MMFRSASLLKSSIFRCSQNQRYHFSTASKTSFLAADAGPAATHVNHKISTFLAIAAPAVIFSPDSWTDGFVDKAFGALLALNISVHSWVGMNYVITDYVPKISKTLLGPARVVSAGMSGVTLFGLGIVAIRGERGVKGLIKGLWTPKETKES
mmetsp:Transcript_12391/g.15482  ORF Transcript_12391/g.15482 Transcript_12391/m.15482 type:complete len:153 (+) Transcript_12391:172-630(+)